MQEEIWKPLQYGKYDLTFRVEVSNYGKLRNIETKHEYKLCINKQGYKGTVIKLGRKKCIYVKVHRAVALMFIDNPLGKPQVNHIDGNKLNNNVCNLEWVTARENLIHAFNNGLKHKGSECSWAKLTREEVDRIRELYSTGAYTHKDLCKLFNVSLATIGEVTRKKTYVYD